MTAFLFSLIASVFVVLSTFAQFVTAESGQVDIASKPNILFILTDNQAASAIGAYGNTDIRTPHIDRLAEDGMLFTNAFATSGMCSPTRASLMTGLMPSQHGVHDWLNDYEMHLWPENWSVIEEFRTLPLTLKNRSYQTAMIGKWHLGQPTAVGPGYDTVITFTQGHTTDFWNNDIIENGTTYRLEDENIVLFFADKAVEYLENYQGDNPFYLQLNFDGPYANPPTNKGPAKNKYYDEYTKSELSSFPRGPVNSSILQQMIAESLPVGAKEYQHGFKEWLKELAEMQNDHASMANFASQNTLVDEAVGRVMAALQKSGLDKNTLVIFSTDQGNMYGQHGLWGHTTETFPSHLYDTAMRIPLIFVHPGAIARGIENHSMVSQYDIMPTLLDYVGFGDVEIENSPGESFSSALAGQQPNSERNAVFFEQLESRGIRTAEYSYWKRLEGTGESELYNLKNDPDQKINLFGLPKYAETASQLDRDLVQFFSVYVDKEYDLWNGGSAKGSVVRPVVFEQRYGENWRTGARHVPPFKEE